MLRRGVLSPPRALCRRCVTPWAWPRCLVSVTPAIIQPPTSAVPGAPFTNSVSLTPSGGAFLLALRAPDYAHVDVQADRGEALVEVASRLGAACGGRVVFFINGLPAPPATTLMSSYNRVLDISLDGFRYSVNAGARFSPSGAVPRRPAIHAIALVGAGGIGLFVACALFWHSLLPLEYNKLKQSAADLLAAEGGNRTGGESKS